MFKELKEKLKFNHNAKKFKELFEVNEDFWKRMSKINTRDVTRAITIENVVKECNTLEELILAVYILGHIHGEGYQKMKQGSELLASMQSLLKSSGGYDA